MTWRWFDCMSNTYHDIKDEEEMTTTENYFKALGWHLSRPHQPNGSWDFHDGEKWICISKLPNINQAFPDFKKWVLEKMEGEGYKLEVDPVYDEVDWFSMKLLTRKNNEEQSKSKLLVEPTKDNEILEAAVVAATRYWEGKK